LQLPQRLTAFAYTLDSRGRLLAVRHERLGITRWELPGGHVEPGEATRAAAARETREEAGVEIEPTVLMAECLHVWRGTTRHILYFLATPLADAAVPVAGESRISAAEWVDLDTLDLTDASPLIRPLVEHRLAEGDAAARPLRFTATHHQTTSGWEPVITSQWQTIEACR
jgi:8-oxo-dGTP pyrophosphatase MutT (NUDIX family)